MRMLGWWLGRMMFSLFSRCLQHFTKRESLDTKILYDK